MVFRQVGNDTDNLINKLGLLNKSFADIKRDLQNGQGFRSFGNFISKQDVENFKKFNSEFEKVGFHKAFNNNLATSHSYIQKQAIAIRELNTQQYLLERQLRSHKITQEQYNTALQTNQAQIKALTTKTNSLTFAQKAASVASKALGTALNVALNVGITLAISAIITGITKLVNAEQEAKEKIEEQAKSAKQLSDDLFDLRKQYITLSKEVETDKSKKEQLTSVTEELLKKLGYEKEAVGDLVDEYGNLDNAINGVSLTALEEAGNALRVEYGNKKSALAKDKNIFDDIFNSGNGRLYSFLIPSGKTINSDVAKALNDSGIFNKNTSFGIDSGKIYLNGSIFSVDEMKQNYQDISDALSLLNSKFKLDVIKDDSIYKALQSKQDELKKVIDEYNSSINNLNNNLAQQEILKGLQGKELPKTKEDFDEFVESVVNASIASEQFIGSEKDIRNSIMAFLETMPEFSSFFVVEQKNVGDTTKSFSDLKKETKSLQETLDSTFSNQSTLQSAFDKIQEGTSLSADDVRKLIDLCKDSYPEIATAFTKTADGYTISANDIISANEAITKSTKEELQNQINEYQKIVDEYNSIKSDPNADRFVGSNLANKASEAKSIINGLRLVMEMFGLTTKDLDDNYKELMDNTSKLASKAKTLSSAFAEQNENGKLSVDTVLSLIENGYAAALMYDKKTGAIRLNAQAYIDLADAEISAQIAELTLAKSNDKASQEKLEVQRDIVSNLGWSYLGTAEAALRMAEAQEKLNNADADLSKYDAQIQALNDLRDNLGNIVNGTYGGSGSTEDLNKKAFEEANNLRKHWLAMGKDKTGKKYTEEMYYAWLDSADGYKNYFSDLTKYTDEYHQYEEEIYKWKKQQDQELFDRNIENIEKLAEKSLNGELPEEVDYTNPLDKFNIARQYYNEAITETQNRINELIESGSGNVQDEINTLKDSLEDFKDKLKDISDEEFEVKITTWENTNGYNDKDINSRTDRSNYVRTLIEEYYYLNSEEYEKYIGEIEEFEQETYKLKVENEKTYWENQQKALEDYYDEKIKKLQDEADEEERITKQKELQLNLIKAQQDLLNAKKNRNQLVFANGGFEYDYNQDDIISKMEAVANAEKDIADNIRDTQIEDLENEKESRSQWFKKLIDKIDEYLKMLNGEVTPTESDTSILNDVIKATDGKDSAIKTFTSFSQLLDSMRISYNKEAVNKLDNDSTASQQFFNNITKTPNVPNLTPAVNYNNSTVNNNSKVDIGNMTINVPEGTTKEQVRSMIDQFANNVIASLRAKVTQIQ